MFYRSDDVIITSTVEVDSDLDVQYYVQALTRAGETIVIPQTAVEATLGENKDNITADIGVEVRKKTCYT